MIDPVTAWSLIWSQWRWILAASAISKETIGLSWNWQQCHKEYREMNTFPNSIPVYRMVRALLISFAAIKDHTFDFIILFYIEIWTYLYMHWWGLEYALNRVQRSRTRWRINIGICSRAYFEYFCTQLSPYTHLPFPNWVRKYLNKDTLFTPMHLRTMHKVLLDKTKKAP